MSPSAVIVIQGGKTKLVNVKTRIQSQKFLIWFLMLSIVLREKMNV